MSLVPGLDQGPQLVVIEQESTPEVLPLLIGDRCRIRSILEDQLPLSKQAGESLFGAEENQCRIGEPLLRLREIGIRQELLDRELGQIESRRFGSPPSA